MADDTVWIVDDSGERLSFARPVRRVVSLVPAMTELLFAIGAGDRVAGRTRFDRHPPEALAVPSVGDGIRPNLERILALEPELVVLFRGPDNRGVAEELRRLGVRTLAVRHSTLADLARNTRRLGQVTGCTGGARRLAARTSRALEEVRGVTAPLPRRRVYYDVWPSPPITVGAGSYLDSLLTLAGGRNVFGRLRGASPQVSLEAIVARRPELIVRPLDSASASPAPLERPGWRALEPVRQGRVRPVDADLVHRLGPRIGEAAAELALAIHPEIGGRLPGKARAAPAFSCGPGS
ncbi:MAG: ABC transporter substrate-binding protein [Gemmatimonadota bacterium]